MSTDRIRIEFNDGTSEEIEWDAEAEAKAERIVAKYEKQLLAALENKDVEEFGQLLDTMQKEMMDE